jgi:hypothetical protein
MTDERNTCRHTAPSGECEQSDFVFSIEEQDNPRLLHDRRVQRDRIEAGHVEIVGDRGARPHKLIESLQRHGILASTPLELREELSQLLSTLF